MKLQRLTIDFAPDARSERFQPGLLLPALVAALGFIAWLLRE